MIAILVYSALFLSVSSINFSEWINPNQITILKTSYYRLLDHNNDNIVNINELRFGILSTAQSDSKLDDTDIASISFIPDRFSCIPSWDFVDFADCITIAARYIFKNNEKTLFNLTQEISFEEAFTKYLGKCTDISPIADKYCHDIVARSPESCSIWSQFHTNPSYCSLSCYSCTKESSIFTDKYPIRGLNGEYTQRAETLSTYDMPQALRNKVNTVNNCSRVANDNHTGNILFVSDVHIEPWYNVAGNGPNSTDWVSRFPQANISNMFQCENCSATNNPIVACTLTNVNEPPLDMFMTAIAFLAEHAEPSNILIYGGDTQPHQFSQIAAAPETLTVPRMLSRAVQYMLAYFPARSVFYTAGNHDGQENSIFCNGSDAAINSAWAGILIEANIINNDLNRKYRYDDVEYTSVSLFNSTGYSIKKIPEIFNNSRDNENFYAIILNTNLGLNNAFQNAMFNDDLEWVKSQKNGHCLVIGHHPNVVQAIIPNEYRSIVRGSFAGHVHYFQPSDSNGFAILPATTQTNQYAAVITSNLNEDGDLVLTWDDFNQYFGAKNSLPQEYCWGYNGIPPENM